MQTPFAFIRKKSHYLVWILFPFILFITTSYAANDSSAQQSQTTQKTTEASQSLTATSKAPLQYYVSASPKAAVRMDPAPSATILRYIILGTPVRIIRENKKHQYALVQTQDGDQGWIAVHNLTHIAPSNKASLLTRVDKEVDHQLQAIKPMAKNIGTKIKSVGHSLTDWKITSGDKMRQTSSYLQSLQMQVKNLEQENAVLAADNSRAWFVVGAAVFLVGLLIGLLIGRAMKKRTNWG